MNNTNQIWKTSCRGIIIDQGQLLVVKLKPTDDFYCLPWGKLEYMETIENCMIREINEELNIVPEVGPMLFINQWLLEKYQVHLIEFFYLITNGADFRHIDLAHSSHGFEIAELKWIDLDDVQTNLLPNFVLDYLRGKTIDQIMTMWTQSVVSY
jgi:8-oxo-dGTP diphosphatase